MASPESKGGPELMYDKETRLATVSGSVTIWCGGWVAATANASYDLTAVPDEYVGLVLHLLTQRPRIISHQLSAQQIQDANAAHERWQEWKALPFWKRWITRRPA